jgi:transglutaminase-like putative cysteine protease
MARRDTAAAASIEWSFQFSLLGLVATGYLALAATGHLDAPTLALTAAGLVLRGLLAGGALRWELSERAAIRATVVYAAFYPLDYLWFSRTLLGATVHLAFFLAVVKILTARTTRDYLYMAAIAFLELLAAAIVSADSSFFVFLALDLLFAIAALTSAEIRRSMEGARLTARARLKGFYPRLAALALVAAAGILALTAGLFFLLPRTADAARSRFAHRIYLPGFSGRVTLGEIGQIKTSSRPVMHIRVFSTDKLNAVKWRGSALTVFDGKHWSNPPLAEAAIATGRGHVTLTADGERREGRHISYDVELDAVETDTLFFAGTPQAIDIREGELLRDSSGNLRRKGRPLEGFQYEVYSLLEDPPETAVAAWFVPALAGAARQLNLQLPRALDSRIPPMARRWTAGADSDLGRARALERRLRVEYGYTLELPPREPADPLANFLFVRRRGHCEYFASAMTVMLRTLGIPARLATGFQSGVYNPITDLWLVRASDAHSWVEAWIPGYGWATFDPTPPDPSLHDSGLAARIGLYLDAADTFWKEWVVSYDPTHQGTLAERVERGARGMGIGWFDSVYGAGSDWDLRLEAWLRRSALRLAVALAVGVWLWLVAPPLVRLLRMRLRISRARRGHAGMGDATVLYRRMLDVVKRLGYQRPLWFTPAEFAASLPRDPLGRAVSQFTESYNALRFGGSSEAAPRLSSLLDEISQQAAMRRR